MGTSKRETTTIPLINEQITSRFGGELTYDFAGKLGFDLGFYINSGSVDVNYGGDLNYVIDNYPSGNRASISSFVDVDRGNLFTVSPKIGAYADLIVELDADVSAVGCLFGCVGGDLINIHFDHTEEMFAVNRQVKDEHDRPVFFDLQGDYYARDRETGNYYDLEGNQVTPPGSDEGILPVFDGEIRYFSLGLEEIIDGVKSTKELLEINEDSRGRPQCK